MEGKKKKHVIVRQRLRCKIWEFFLPDASKLSAKCRVCYKVLNIGTGGSTTVLRKHLRSTHGGDDDQNLILLRRELEVKEGFNKVTAGNDKDLPGSRPPFLGLSSTEINIDQFAEEDEDEDQMEGDPLEEGNSKKGRKPSIRSAPVWKYFTRSEDNKSATCKICGAVVTSTNRKTVGCREAARHVGRIHNVSYDTLFSNEPKTKICFRKPSPAWEFFEVVIPRETARCKICDVIIVTREGTTNGMTYHVKAKHGKSYEAARVELRKRMAEEGRGQDGEDVGGGEPEMADADDSDNDDDILDQLDEVKQEAVIDMGEVVKVEVSEPEGDFELVAEDDDPLRDDYDYQDQEEEAGQSQGMEEETQTCFVCNEAMIQDMTKLPEKYAEYQVFLMEMLEIPQDKSEKYLEQLQLPLCYTCQIVVREGLTARKRIIRLQLQVERCQRHILEHIVHSKKMGEGKDSSKQQHDPVLDGIRKFVRSRKYPVLEHIQVDDKLGSESEADEHHPLPSDASDNDNDDDDGSEVDEPQVLYCGLCDDDKVYKSETQLTRHTNEAHRPSPPPSTHTTISSIAHSMTMAVKNSRLVKEPTQPMSSIARSMTMAVKNARLVKEKEPPTLPQPKTRKRPSQSIPAVGGVPRAWSLPGSRFQYSNDDLPDSWLFSKYRYQCPTCPEMKELPVDKYAVHLDVHQRRPNQCAICLSFFPADESIQERHWKERHSTADPLPKFIPVKFNPGLIWKCDSCLEGFVEEEERNQHEMSCLPEDILKAKSSLPLERNKPNQCLTCHLRFRNLDEWRLHRLLHHPEVDRRSCYYCDKPSYEMTLEGVETRNDNGLLHHMKKAHGVVKLYDDCDYCGVIFSTSGSGKLEHMVEKHGLSNKKLYSCVICELSFVRIRHLRRHMSAVHFQNPSSHVCEMCGSKFRAQDSLTQHMLVSHEVIPEGLEVIRCSEEGCSYKTVFAARYSEHLKTAHGPKAKAKLNDSFICSYCGQGFKTQGTFREHEAKHVSGDLTLVECQRCGGAFANKHQLKRHMLESHPPVKKKKRQQRTRKPRKKNEDKQEQDSE